MAASKGRHSYGTTLGIDPAGGTSYTAIAEVIDLDQSGLKVTKTSLTNLASPSATMENTPGFVDPGQLKAKLNFTEAQFALFLTYLRTASMSMEITYPKAGAQTVAATLVGKGQIAEIGQTFPDDDRITVDVTFDASGPWTFSPGTPEI